MAASAALAAPASAEVVSRTADGFALRFQSGMETTPEDMIATVGELPKWWDKAHTYTGDNANLSLDFEPGGCWCETMADGARFQHARVVSITPDTVVFDAVAGEGVFDFTVRTAAMSALVYAVAGTVGSA